MTEVHELLDAQHPTNSMVTVRLSDVQIHPEVKVDVADPDDRFSTRSVSATSEASSSSSNSHNEIMSMESVDWDGLEKTEEQERCEDNTDEVSYVTPNI